MMDPAREVELILSEIGPRLDDAVCDYCGEPLGQERKEFDLPYSQTPLVVCESDTCRMAATLKSKEAWLFAKAREEMAKGQK